MSATARATAEDISKAYGLTKAQGEKVAEIAQRMALPDPGWLAALIWFESNFDPQKKGPGTAWGLGQFTDIALQQLGVSNAQLKAMNFDDQMELLFRHLTEGRPYANRLIDLAMNHFYPKAFGKPDYIFPENVQRANPGIRTPRDYEAKLRAKARLAPYDPPEFQWQGPPMLGVLPPVGIPADGWRFWFNVAGLVVFGGAMIASLARVSRRSSRA